MWTTRASSAVADFHDGEGRGQEKEGRGLWEEIVPPAQLPRKLGPQSPSPKELDSADNLEEQEAVFPSLSR